MLISLSLPFSFFLPLLTSPLSACHRVLSFVGRRHMGLSLRLLLGLVAWHPRFGIDLFRLWVTCPLLVCRLHPFVFWRTCMWLEDFLLRLLELPPVVLVSTGPTPIVRSKPCCLTSTASTTRISPSGILHFLRSLFVEYSAAA